MEVVTMKQFAGLHSVDQGTRAALLAFAYHLAVGNLDEAYKSVKQIASPAVWENMTHMCIKTKRLDVAEYCLGNMGASSLQQSSTNRTLTLKVNSMRRRSVRTQP